MSETPDHVAAAQKRAVALQDGRDRRQEWVDALLAERHGYVLRGLDDRVAQVDAALAAAGHVVDKPAPRRGRKED